MFCATTRQPWCDSAEPLPSAGARGTQLPPLAPPATLLRFCPLQGRHRPVFPFHLLWIIIFSFLFLLIFIELYIFLCSLPCLSPPLQPSPKVPMLSIYSGDLIFFHFLCRLDLCMSLLGSSLLSRFSGTVICGLVFFALCLKTTYE